VSPTPLLFPQVPQSSYGPSNDSPIPGPLTTNSIPIQPVIPQSQTKVRQVLPILEKVFELQKELFKLPIDLDSLIPQYTQKLPPTRMVQIYDRIQELKKRTEEMLLYHENLTQVFKHEKLITDLSSIIRDGQKQIGNMREFIAAKFPSSDPNSKHPRMLMAFLMEWYIHLCQVWEGVLDEHM